MLQRSALARLLRPSASVNPPSGFPLWRQGAVLNEWFQISSTSGAGGAHGYAFSGCALRESTNEIIIAAAGGHGDGFDNKVSSIALSDNAPAWVQRRAASSSPANDVFYYSDGRRASAHLYSMIHHIPQRDRVMIFGLFGTYPNAFGSAQVDGFNLDPLVNDWDAAATWSDLASGQSASGTCLNSAIGDVWATLGTSVYKWDQATATQTKLHDFGGAGEMARLCTWDSTRNQLVTIGFGNGRDQDATKTLNFFKIPSNGLTRTALTLTGSAATQFQTDAPYAFSIEYVAALDKIYIYTGGLGIVGGGAGQAGSTKDIYVLTPDNTATAWDISLLLQGAGSITPVTPGINGIHSKFRYIPALGGCSYVAFDAASNASPNVYFIRIV